MDLLKYPLIAGPKLKGLIHVYVIIILPSDTIDRVAEDKSSSRVLLLKVVKVEVLLLD